MTDDSNAAQITKLEDEAEVFPPQMMLLPTLFEFSFAKIDKFASTAFSSTSDIMQRLDALRVCIQDSALDEDDKEQMLQLIREELEVVSYSQSARCSVIAI